MRETHDFLFQRGQVLQEGVALWIVKEAQPSQIVRVEVPEQRSLSAAIGACIEIGLEGRERLTRKLHRQGEFAVAQIHSHPGEAFHSEIDDRYPILHHRGAYSIVVPHFASAPVLDLRQVEVFRLEKWPSWHRLTPSERARAFEVVP